MNVAVVRLLETTHKFTFISNLNASTKMKRTVVSMAIIGIFGLCFSLAAQGPAPKNIDDPVLQRLDQILTRLTSIENRLKRLEVGRSAAPDWTVDGQGIIKMPDGRPIGIWGVGGQSKQGLPSKKTR